LAHNIFGHCVFANFFLCNSVFIGIVRVLHFVSQTYSIMVRGY